MCCACISRARSRSPGPRAGGGAPSTRQGAAGTGAWSTPRRGCSSTAAPGSRTTWRRRRAWPRSPTRWRRRWRPTASPPTRSCRRRAPASPTSAGASTAPRPRRRRSTPPTPCTSPRWSATWRRRRRAGCRASASRSGAGWSSTCARGRSTPRSSATTGASPPPSSPPRSPACSAPAPSAPTRRPRSGRSSTGRAAPIRGGALRERVADRLAATFERLHVEKDRQQVLHVEGAGGEVAGHEIVVLLDADAVILLLVPLDLFELLVDLFAGREQQPEVVVARRLDGLVALGEEDELLRLLGQEDVAELADDLGVDAGPAEHAPVEGVDLLSELGRERPAWERQLHVVEPHLRHPGSVLSSPLAVKKSTFVRHDAQLAHG